jgi:oligopeptide transport system permease protein
MFFSRKRLNAIAAMTQNNSNPAGRSLWQDALGRFRKNKAAVASLVIIILLVIFALLGGALSPYQYDEIDYELMGASAEQGHPSLENAHYFGVDELGRDIYMRVVQGTQISLLVGILGSLVTVIIGTLYGATAGYLGGKIDNIMMRIVEILQAIPFIFVVILLMVMFGRNLVLIFVAIGAVSWLEMARLVRGQTLSLKNQAFVEAAKALGLSAPQIIVRHIIPNTLGVVAVSASLLVPGMILFESFLSFLGLGVQEPQTSWGALIAEGANAMQFGMLWQLIFPSVFFVVCIFSFNFLGDGIRDALDPTDH